MIIALALAALVGVTLGALGSGGAILTTPLLVYVAGIPPRTAVGITLAVVSASSGMAAFLHYRRGNYHWKATVLLGSAGAPGAWLGSSWTRSVPEPVLMLLFAAAMLGVAMLMFVHRHSPPPVEHCHPLRCVSIGFLVGVLTGFLGVGGGFLLLPALTLFAGIEARRAIGASLSIITVNSLAGLAGHLRYAHVDAGITAAFLLATIAGMTGGVALSSVVPERILRTSFALLLVAVGLTVGVINVTRL